MENYDCKTALFALYHFLDGELASERTKAVEGHLEECTHCNGAFVFESSFKMVVRRQVTTEIVPDALRQRIFTAIEIERHGPLNS